MRIGSMHRMRNLDANTITLREKELNVASFFSGLITSQFYIAPNFVISLLLEKEENARDYVNMLQAGVNIVLNEFPVKRFDARTTTFNDVLSNIGESYHRSLPKLYHALINKEISIKQDMDDFFDSVARDLEADVVGDEEPIQTLKNKIEEQAGVIKMLQNMLDGQDLSGGSTEYIAKIEALKSKVASLEQWNKEKDHKISELQIQLARIDLMETRIQSLQAGLTERDAEIADLRSKLTSVSGLSGNATVDSSTTSAETQVWKSKVLELQRELKEQTMVLNKLKKQLAENLSEIEAQALLSELSGKTMSQSPFDEELEDEMKSRYITL